MATITPAYTFVIGDSAIGRIIASGRVIATSNVTLLDRQPTAGIIARGLVIATRINDAITVGQAFRVTGLVIISGRIV